MLSISEVRLDLERHLPRLVLRHDVPGASVAVAVGDAAFAAAAGVVNRSTGIAATPDSVFQIQSITKVWTATLVMQLVDEGLVGLDDPVRAHLPGFRTADLEASKQITIRHLLTHTGGFEGDLWKSTTAGDDALRRLVEDWIPRAPQHEPPGSRYSYCSAGMAVLGRLVEIKRGTPFASALRAHLARPLGIEELACNANEALAFNTAIGHAAHGDGARPLPVWATMPESNPAAGNQLSMSARALLSFGRMHLADGVAPGGARVLSKASARSMRVPETEIPASRLRPKHVGLTWEISHGGNLIGHGGGAIGFSSVLYLLPEHQTAIAVLTNGGDFKGFMRDLVDPWIEHAVQLNMHQDRQAPSPQVVAEPGRYIGVYGVHNQEVSVFVAQDGTLRSSLRSTGDALTMIARAGLDAAPWDAELRQHSGDLFALVDANGDTSGHAEFLDTGRDGRAGFFHMSGRTLPRLPDRRDRG